MKVLDNVYLLPAIKTFVKRVIYHVLIFNSFFYYFQRTIVVFFWGVDYGPLWAKNRRPKFSATLGLFQGRGVL